MTDEVGELVLRDNYLQTLSITVTNQLGVHLLDRLGRFMRRMEKSGRLDRKLEFLPDDEELGERAAKGVGLTHPELSVLLSYAKMELYDRLLASDLPDDGSLAGDLERYFPRPLREHFSDRIAMHRLRREIVATLVTNEMINRVGITFAHEVHETTGFPEAEIARAYLIARDIFGIQAYWEEIEALDTKPFVVIDEVQKVPQILDEVHWLHEAHGLQFALCGSSARKVKRGAVNQLGGRAVRYELRGLTSAELASAFDLERILNHGFLPRVYESSHPKRLLNSYVADYLKEEVASEGLVRNLPVFSEFLNIASLSDTHPVNYSNIARECGVSSQTVRGYFEILEDTLMARWLPSYRKRPKRRVIHSPKLYFADVGVVGFLARRGRLEAGSELFENAFENWCFHEITAYNCKECHPSQSSQSRRFVCAG